MPLKTEQVEEPSLNLTPMIDIVFLLIIFFMVGTQFTEQERLFELNMPQVSAAPPLTSLPDDMVINIHQDGRMIISGVEYSLPDLEQKLKEARLNYDDQGVVIRHDADGIHQNLMHVLSACHSAQIRNISIAGQLQGEKDR
ncbi:biopolymer transport protein ExbD [Polystyrenella longa]|uniref:Biopolymer transport protein ExbD n=1 Tax=Polystyrenella longa TaxID=2528007 RepID=A0A518CHZ0_9PLAN|nr:biopolymer transporter ExbD [Polystyrenella longa]QDU78845.1 biopolymer transport protein ExbD [Polystyrenella longa]